MGETENRTTLVVVFTTREGEIRIISARPVTKQGINRYESGI
ncbi:MAG: hypothetical protein LH647_15780 [Leptolyngbyaceae cyanobacterium CAN_BIN12]|nr:hypothetical protein [Leptolyngbyaceae cyanobacterium CAN_BIN12]